MKKAFVLGVLLLLAVSLSAPIVSAHGPYYATFNVHKFNDLNGDGVQDAGEPDLAGVLIRVYQATSTSPFIEVVAEGVTDSDGLVTFSDLTITNPAGAFVKIWEPKIDCWEPTAPANMIEGEGGYWFKVDISSGPGPYTVDIGNHYTCNGGGEGCTPGFWKQEQHLDSWVGTGFSPGDIYSTVFGVGPSVTLLEALETGGGGENALARHATAALLNAASPGVGYYYSVFDVQTMVQQAYATGDFEGAKDLLEIQNELGCPLD